MRVLAGLLLLAAAVRAQSAIPDDPRAAREAAQQRLAALGEGEDAWRRALQRRIDLLDELLAVRESPADPADLEARRQAAEEALADLRAKPAPTAVTLASPEGITAYEKTLAEAQAERDEARAALERVKERLKRAQAAEKAFPDREKDARQRLEQNRNGDELSRFRAENARLELAVIGERRAFLKEALPRWNALLPVLQLELDAATLRHERADKQLQLAREEAARLRQAESERIQRQAEREKRAAERERDPVERLRHTLAAETKEVQAETAALAGVVDQLQAAIDERATATKMIEQQRRQLEQRLAVDTGGASDVLRTALERTRRARRLLIERTLPRRADEARRYQEQLVDTYDRLWELQQPADDNAVLQSALAELPDERREEAMRAFEAATEGPDGLLAALRHKANTLESIGARHGALAAENAAHAEALEQLAAYVQSQLYWSPSAPRISLTPRAYGGELSRLASSVRRQRWGALGSAGLALLAGGPLLLVVLLFLARGVSRRAQAWPTAGREAARLLAALVPPGVLYAAAGAVKAADFPRDVKEPVSALFGGVALFLLARRGVGWLLGDEGLVARFGRVPAPVTRLVRRSVRWLTNAGLLFLVPAQVLRGAPFELEHVTRLLESLWMLGVALSFILLIGRRSALIEQMTAPQGSARRLWVLIGPLVSAGLLLIVALDLLGYRIGASYLMLNAGRTLLAAMVLAGLHLVLVRVIGALAAKARARAAEEEGAAAAWSSSSAMTQQLTRLAAMLLTGAALVVLLHFWGVGQILVNALEGVEITQIDDQRALTLWDLFLALVWIVAGHLVVRNLGAVYEHFVFPLLGSEDRGGRFVALTLSRYAILVVAYSAAVLTLGFSFSNLGWLLAAASVGIGFGLQEIIANFVSGLILLIERPVRVGDIITVGETGGTVEKINIRATTVVNWDRQTILIPNKDFITQNLINWTHNDQNMRRKIRVGVAYGSDVTKVLRILEEVVGKHPKVLRDPPPRIWFDGFGESSLDFDVWFFARIDEGLATRTEVNRQIYERFAQEGVQIPFPQRDLWIKSVPEREGVAGLLEGREGS